MKLFIAVLISSLLPVVIIVFIDELHYVSSFYEFVIEKNVGGLIVNDYISIGPYTFMACLLLGWLFSFLVKRFKFSAMLFYLCSFLYFTLAIDMVVAYKGTPVTYLFISTSFEAGLVLALSATPLFIYFKKKLKTASQEK